MATELEPIIGEWYLHRGRDQSFNVIDVDEDESLVEVQDASGAVYQIELAAWYEMDLETTEEPEDWSATLGEIESELDYESQGRSGWSDDVGVDADWTSDEEEEDWSELRDRTMMDDRWEDEY